jgi:formylglycine-generating enzyme required for sulfatase activity
LGAVLVLFGLVLLMPMASRAQTISLLLLIETGPKITVNGPPGSHARVEWSENLEGPWNVWSNIVVEVAGTVLVDVSPGSTMRFYRTVGLPTPSDEGFALIPAGSFEMGDNFGDWPSEWGANPSVPVHTVNVSAFYMGRTEVTKAQWDEVRTWAVNNGYTNLNSGGGKGANHPVHSVNWFDVVKWCNAASERDGLTPVYTLRDGSVYRTGDNAPTIHYGASGYRLPSEAEWEKAARGGVEGQRFPWGNTISHANANYYSSSSYSYDVSPTRDHHPQYDTGEGPYTSPVGSFAPNAFGLYDMVGNVGEWCNDWFEWNYYANSPSSNPRRPASGSARVIRGGGWVNDALDCRSAFRFFYHPDGRSDHIGFRLARSSVP